MYECILHTLSFPFLQMTETGWCSRWLQMLFIIPLQMRLVCYFWKFGTNNIKNYNNCTLFIYVSSSHSHTTWYFEIPHVWRKLPNVPKVSIISLLAINQILTFFTWMLFILSFANLGIVISHEITHGFDHQGKKCWRSINVKFVWLVIRKERRIEENERE